MLYCKKCKKEVVIIAVSLGAIFEGEVESQREILEKEGKIILFNPPPFLPYKCPICQMELVEK